jgi:peptidoglycan hydrolase-like protein with peptidoglycan-binding domain
MRRLATALLAAALALVASTAARAAVDPDAAALQVALRAQGYYDGPIDGVAGPATKAAVVRFQRGAGLVPDGVAGPLTREALGVLGRPRFGKRLLLRGRVGWDVSVLQFLLGRRDAWTAPDGDFGRATERSVRRFQRKSRLAVDGVAGPFTRHALLGKPPPPAPPPPAPPLPSALSGGAAVLSSRSARLTGTVNPQGLPTTWLFEYGRTTGYGSQTPAVTTGTGTAPEAVSADVAGLTPGTTYHYRLRASNSAGTVFGADRSFTTSRRRLADLPLPAIARTFNVEPVRGRVRVGIPGGAAAARRGSAAQKGVRFVPLEEARQVPVGSYFDVRQGTVRIRSATGTGRRTQQGDFVGALFQMLQRRAGRERGLTEARLKGASFRSCQARGAGAPTDQRHLSRRTVRRLRANARGRFRTRGRYSAATVRGTEWTTTDRCDGTLTSVKRGRVVVRDFRLTRTIVVRAGKSYLARAPG